MTSKRKLSNTDRFWLTVLVGGALLLWVSGGSSFAAGGLILLLSPVLLIAVVLWLLWRAGNRSDPAVVIQGPSGTSPGWYPDQHDSTLVRWFDGQSWTSATLPRTGA